MPHSNGINNDSTLTMATTHDRDRTPRTFDDVINNLRNEINFETALENLLSGSEHCNNPEFTRLLYTHATHLVREVSAEDDNSDPRRTFAVIVAVLHTMFEFGLLIGMRMEGESFTPPLISSPLSSLADASIPPPVPTNPRADRSTIDSTKSTNAPLLPSQPNKEKSKRG